MKKRGEMTETKNQEFLSPEYWGDVDGQKSVKDHREVSLLEEHELHMGCVEFEVKNIPVRSSPIRLQSHFCGCDHLNLGNHFGEENKSRL